jgi:hypothetical protein
MLKRLPLLVIALLVVSAAGNFIVRDFLASSLVAFGEDGASRDLALRYSPADPSVVAARAKYLIYRAEPPRPEEGISGLQRATQLSPRDYRFWLELGRAYENTGNLPAAEKALARSVELAPAYFETRWTLANFYLRTGRNDLASSDLREAIILSGRDGRPDERATLNTFNAISGATGNDFDFLKKVAPDDEVSQAYLAGFLSNHDGLDQAFQIWRRLTGSHRESFRSLTLQLIRESQLKGRFQDGYQAWEKLAIIEGLNSRDPGNLVFNPGFEQKPLSETYTELASSQSGFDWIIGRHPEVRARRTDLEKHTGSFSLGLNFAAAMSQELQEISIIVPVDHSGRHELTWFVKTKNIPLLEDEAPFIEISDPLRPSEFSQRTRIPAGTNEWSEQKLSIDTPIDTRGLKITIRSPRMRTVDRSRVPEVWFDDFKMR